MTQLINQLIFLAINLAMAWYHADLIRDNKRIKHGLWAAGYLGAVLLWCVIFSWWYLPVLLLQRAMVFSPALNLLRSLPINYMSSSTTSIIDKLEYKLFKGNWYKRMAYYLAAWLAITILIEIA